LVIKWSIENSGKPPRGKGEVEERAEAWGLKSE
jgi:hypothetical protein